MREFILLHWSTLKWQELGELYKWEQGIRVTRRANRRFTPSRCCGEPGSRPDQRHRQLRSSLSRTRPHGPPLPRWRPRGWKTSLTAWASTPGRSGASGPPRSSACRQPHGLARALQAAGRREAPQPPLVGTRAAGPRCTSRRCGPATRRRVRSRRGPSRSSSSSASSSSPCRRPLQVPLPTCSVTGLYRASATDRSEPGFIV